MKSLNRYLLLIIITALLCSTGCQSLGTYFKDRANDFADCFKLTNGHVKPCCNIDQHTLSARNIDIL